MKIQGRLKVLEQRLIHPPIVLQMPDGRIKRLSGCGNNAFDLLFRVVSGERTPEIELIAQSISSTEPGGGHLIDRPEPYYTSVRQTPSETWASG